MRFQLVIDKRNPRLCGIKDTEMNLVAIGFGDKTGTMYCLNKLNENFVYPDDYLWESEDETIHYIEYIPKQRKKEYVHGM